MSGLNERRGGWKESLLLFRHPRVLTMLFLGISAGIPLLLIFSSLSLWLREAGVERSAVTFFSWAALAYSFKFVWAPLVDSLPIPVLSRRLGRRRAWLLLAQFAVIGSICAMAMIDPSSSDHNLVRMAWAAVFLGFSSATQDIVIDAYRIESAEPELQALMSSTYIAGYRVGMILAGAGALFLASWFGTSVEQYEYSAWRQTYFCMALAMFVGVVTTVVVSEPTVNAPATEWHRPGDYLRFLGLFAGCAGLFVSVFFESGPYIETLAAELSQMTGSTHIAAFVVEICRLAIAVVCVGLAGMAAIRLGLVNRGMVVSSYLEPVRDFFGRFGAGTALLLLALIAFYRISDIVLGVISNVFFQDMGFTKTEIASVVKTFGLLMTLAGGFLGGILVARFGVMRILFLGAVLTVVTNLAFMYQAQVGHDLTVLYVVISADNLSAGLASAAFIAFLSSLTNVSFTAMQYAIFSSIMTLLPKLIGGYSGAMVEALGYPVFFLLASAMGLPVLLLIAMAGRYFELGSETEAE